MTKLRTLPKWKSFLLIAGGSYLGGNIFMLVQGNEKYYQKRVMPLVHSALSPESAHRLGVYLASWNLVPRSTYQDLPVLKAMIWGKEFKNPIGLAAGFDKNAEAVDGLLRMGFGFVEVGSITPLPQPGNPKPRVFRLSQDYAVINRYGFNSVGHSIALENLKRLYPRCQSLGIVGVNVGKNKESEDPLEDYSKGILAFNDVSDYLVINVSSPNTPGLRTLQNKESLSQLLDKSIESRRTLKYPKPLLIKIAPDLTEDQKKDIAHLALNKGVDGLIICNTTISRPESLKDEGKDESGGLSGKPLEQMSTALIRDMYRLTQGKIPIIGVGGVSSGEDAYRKIKAGASLIQLYSVLIYEGPPVVTRIKKELAEILTKDNYKSISEAVGADHRYNLKS